MVHCALPLMWGMGRPGNACTCAHRLDCCASSEKRHDGVHGRALRSAGISWCVFLPPLASELLQSFPPSFSVCYLLCHVLRQLSSLSHRLSSLCDGVVLAPLSCVLVLQCPVLIAVRCYQPSGHTIFVMVHTLHFNRYLPQVSGPICLRARSARSGPDEAMPCYQWPDWRITVFRGVMYTLASLAFVNIVLLRNHYTVDVVGSIIFTWYDPRTLPYHARTPLRFSPTAL
eukprot:46030-Rhodomonas_salina.1